MATRILIGDCRETLPQLVAPDSIHCCVTSPPFLGLRSYLPDRHPHKHKEIGIARVSGLEQDYRDAREGYIASLVDVFRAVRHVLRDDGIVFLELGDSYVGTICKKSPDAKDLLGVPWRTAFALQQDGWHLRQDIVLHRKNPTPAPLTDRCVSAHTFLFMLTKTSNYHFDHLAIREPAVEARSNNSQRRIADGTRGRPADHLGSSIPWENKGQGRNRRDVWSYASRPFHGFRGRDHFAVMSPDIVGPCILAGAPDGGTVLDPFGGAMTTAMVAERLGRNAVACELNEQFAAEFRGRVNAAGEARVEPTDY
jgi:DNA modification methylase